MELMERPVPGNLGDNLVAGWETLVADPSVSSCLSSAETWGFDAFQLDSVTRGRPLSTLGYWILQSTGLLHKHGDSYSLI